MIARPRVSHTVSQMQTEAMDLSGPSMPEHIQLNKADSPSLPMDLSTASSKPPTNTSHNHNVETHEKLADPPDTATATPLKVETVEAAAMVIPKAGREYV